MGESPSRKNLVLTEVLEPTKDNHIPWSIESKGTRVSSSLSLASGTGDGGGKRHLGRESGDCSGSLPGKLHSGKSPNLSLLVCKMGMITRQLNHRIDGKNRLSFSCDCGPEEFNSFKFQRE